MNLKEENKIIILYLLLGGLWIYFSDRALYFLFDDKNIIEKIQTYKGWIFVLITGLIFYTLIKKYFERIRETKKELKSKNEELNKYTSQLEDGNKALKVSYDYLYEQTEDLKIMVDFINDINKEEFLEEENFLSKLLQTTFKLIPKSDYGSIYKIVNDNVKYIDTIGHDLEKLKKIKLDKEIFKIHKNEPQIIYNLLEENKNRVSLEKYEKLLEASKEIKQSLTFSLMVEGNIVAGISLDLSKDSDKDFIENDINTLEAFRNLAESFYTLQMYNKLQGEFQRDIILSMIKFLEEHDRYTGGHSEEVAELSSAIAKKMGLSSRDIKDAYWAGLIHDIGKLLIPKDILNKKEKFTKEDYRLIHNHPVWANNALKKSQKLNKIAKYVYSHHERWDGKGYPNGLKEKEIPLISRIISIADAYSAMTSDRAYRTALSDKEAIDEIKDGSGKQFDPEIVEVFNKKVNGLSSVV